MEETPFEFKATPSADMLENPVWNNLVNQMKVKHKK